MYFEQIERVDKGLSTTVTISGFTLDLEDLGMEYGEQVPFPLVGPWGGSVPHVQKICKFLEKPF